MMAMPPQVFAYMTLFNDNGNWTAATLSSPVDEKVVYRACRNSSDRNESEVSKGSLAIICISVSPSEKMSLI